MSNSWSLQFGTRVWRELGYWSAGPSRVSCAAHGLCTWLEQGLRAAPSLRGAEGLGAVPSLCIPPQAARLSKGAKTWGADDVR